MSREPKAQTITVHTRREIGKPMLDRIQTIIDHPKEKALKIVEEHSFYAAAIGIVPIPWIDAAGVSAVQLKMLYSLTEYYGQKFSDNWGKEILSSLVGGFGSTAASYGGVGAITRSIPVVGPLVGLLTTPSLAAASTYALGSVFITFFENNGEFLDVDIHKLRHEWKKEMNKSELKENLLAQKSEIEELRQSNEELRIQNIEILELLRAQANEQAEQTSTPPKKTRAAAAS